MNQSNSQESRVRSLEEVLSQLKGLGDRVETLADRIKRVVERADALVQQSRPKLGGNSSIDLASIAMCSEAEVRAAFDFSTSVPLEQHRLVVSRWNKQNAENADGKWHILYEVTTAEQDLTYGGTYGESPGYCQPLPSAKLSYRQRAMPFSDRLLHEYFEAGRKHLEEQGEAEAEIAKLELRISELHK